MGENKQQFKKGTPQWSYLFNFPALNITGYIMFRVHWTIWMGKKLLKPLRLTYKIYILEVFVPWDNVGWLCMEELGSYRRCELVSFFITALWKNNGSVSDNSSASHGLAYGKAAGHHSHLYSCNMTPMKHKDSNIHTACTSHTFTAQNITLVITTTDGKLRRRWWRNSQVNSGQVSFWSAWWFITVHR